MEKMFEIPVGTSAMECFHAKMLESLFGSFNGLHDHETSILVEAMKRGDEESIRKLAEVTHSDVATVRDCIGRLKKILAKSAEERGVSLDVAMGVLE